VLKHGKMQTLIIDSSIEITERLKQLIMESGAGKTIYTALNYGQAFDIVNNLKPQAIVLDMNLPCNESYRILNDVAKANPDILVIVLSIHIDTYIKNKCLALGADYFFDKYNEFDQLPAILKIRSAG
jgi:DNA-binding NarL/FixJ family response regulator